MVWGSKGHALLSGKGLGEYNGSNPKGGEAKSLVDLLLTLGSIQWQHTLMMANGLLLLSLSVARRGRDFSLVATGMRAFLLAPSPSLGLTIRGREVWTQERCRVVFDRARLTEGGAWVCTGGGVRCTSQEPCFDYAVGEGGVGCMVDWVRPLAGLEGPTFSVGRAKGGVIDGGMQSTGNELRDNWTVSVELSNLRSSKRLAKGTKSPVMQ